MGKFLQSVGEINFKLAFRPWGSGVLDYAFLRALALKYKVRKYLEIGTYIGESLKAVADICEQCYSITAPQGSPYAVIDSCKFYNLPDYTDRLANDPNVMQFYCDSKAFNWAEAPEDIDLYFIDGDHSYKGVYCDTKNVFATKKESAIVVWHDFKNSNPTLLTSEVATAVKDAIGEEFDKVFCVDNNMCGVYLPKIYQHDFQLRSLQYTEKPQALYVYDVRMVCNADL